VGYKITNCYLVFVYSAFNNIWYQYVTYEVRNKYLNITGVNFRFQSVTLLLLCLLAF